MDMEFNQHYAVDTPVTDASATGMSDVCRESAAARRRGFVARILLVVAVLGLCMLATSCDDDYYGYYDDYGLVGTWAASTPNGMYYYQFYDDGTGECWLTGDVSYYFINYTIGGGILSLQWDNGRWTDEGYIDFNGYGTFSLTPMDGGPTWFFNRV